MMQLDFVVIVLTLTAHCSIIEQVCISVGYSYDGLYHSWC